MAGVLLAPYQFGDTSLNNYIGVLNKSILGFFALTIDYHASVNPLERPSIIYAGSTIEVNGNLYYFQNNENMSIILNEECYNYLKLVVSGDTVTASTTTTAPTWSNAKQGWYSGNDRYFYKFYVGNSLFLAVSNRRYMSKQDYLNEF